MQVVRNILDSLARSVVGRTAAEANASSECIRCNRNVNTDELQTEDATEYALSGICPGCWNDLLPDEEDCE